MANKAYYDFISSRLVGPESPDVHQQYRPTDDPVFASPYGPFPPVAPDLNVHEYCFPPENPLPPQDYNLYINASTDEKLTIHQFYSRIKCLARALRYDGPNPLRLSRSPVDDKEVGREIIGICSRNHFDWPVIAHACFRSELVFGGISPSSTSYELWHVIRKMQITSIIVHESLLPVLKGAIKLGKEEPEDGGLAFVLGVKKIVVLADDKRLDEFEGYPTVEWLIRLGASMEEPKRKILGGNKLAFMFQSSGTSGLPKAMMITHSNAIATAQQTMVNAKRIAEFMDQEPTHQTLLGVIPAYHSYGMILWILRMNLWSVTMILIGKWNLELALRSIQKYRITMLPLVPPLVRQLAQSPLTEKYDLSSVTAAASGAAYLPPDVAHQLGKKLPQQFPLPSGYGLSEAASISQPITCGIFGLPPNDLGTNTVGYLLPGMSARIVDPVTLRDVPRNTPGEFWVRGKNVTPGYFKDPKATKELYAEQGWLRTGDLCMRDEWDGITYLDRFKELIKVKGLQVAPTEIEDTLLGHPEGLVRDACVMGIEEGAVVVPRAWVVLSDKAKEMAQRDVFVKLEISVKEKLSRYKWLDGGIEAVAEIPRTNSGKMLRREMRDRYYERTKGQKNRPKL